MKYILSKETNNYDNSEKKTNILYYAGMNIISENGVNTVSTPNRNEAYKYNSKEAANNALNELYNMSTFKKGFCYKVEKY